MTRALARRPKTSIFDASDAVCAPLHALSTGKRIEAVYITGQLKALAFLTRRLVTGVTPLGGAQGIASDVVVRS